MTVWLATLMICWSECVLMTLPTVHASRVSCVDHAAPYRIYVSSYLRRGWPRAESERVPAVAVDFMCAPKVSF